MIIQFKRTLLVITLFALCSGLYGQKAEESRDQSIHKKYDFYPRFSHAPSDIEFGFWGWLRQESFAAKNFTLINNNEPTDQIWYFRYTLDFNMFAKYGKETYGRDVVEFVSSWRSRSVWGDPASIADTIEADLRILNVTTGEHRHGLPRNFPWMREGWMRISLNEAFCLPFANQQTLTLGFFPFQLGRGIALGAGYAVGPGPLGFYSDSAINQYAPGIKLSGDIIKDRLSYDLYGEIIRSRSNSTFQTSAKVRTNEIGHPNHPDERGFGRDSYLVATHLMWYAIKNKTTSLLIEPYVMYANDPEQKIEFNADSSAKLGTWGLAAEWIGPKFEWGVDTAFNMGHQHVRAWDRNQIKFENHDGYVIEVNDKVHIQGSPCGKENCNKAPNVPGSCAQKAINNKDNRGIEFNCKDVPNGDLPCGLGYIQGPAHLVNDIKRFREEYQNKFNGYMCVGDCGWWIYEKELMLAFTAGIATGDQNPNFDVLDRVYSGFIGLQEIYSGKRVRNVFLLGNVGRLSRPGNRPVSEDSPKEFATHFNGFTNLIMVGSSLNWKPVIRCHKWWFNPNVIAYWENDPGFKYKARLGEDTDKPARSYLGTEANLMIEYFAFDSLKMFMIGSVFVPGGHYTDIKGRPVNGEQQRKIEQLIRTGYDKDRIPNIGDDLGYTVNIGFDYTF